MHTRSRHTASKSPTAPEKRADLPAPLGSAAHSYTTVTPHRVRGAGMTERPPKDVKRKAELPRQGRSKLPRSYEVG